MKLFFDGGCQPNPGEMEICVVAGGEIYHQPKLGYGTNNVAEWLALIYSLKIAESLGQTEFETVGDSMLVVNQANGVWQCKSEDLKPFLAEFQQQRQKFAKVKISHVRRHQNLAGIALEKGSI